MKTQLSIIILATILFAANMSQAAVVYFDTTNPMVEPGETISVTIFSTVETASIRMDRISDADFGIASNLYLNLGYDGLNFNEGTMINSGGILIEGIRGDLGTPSSPEVSGVLYSFDYTVSEEALYGEIINIFADSSGGAINEIDVTGTIENITPESLTLTVVPEPGTIALLGLGLVLARKIRRRE